MLTDLLTMTGSVRQQARHSVLINGKDACTGSNAITFSQSFEHTIDSLIISMEPSKDAGVASTEFSTTFQTTVERRTMWSVIADHLDITFDSLAAAWAMQQSC